MAPVAKKKMLMAVTRTINGLRKVEMKKVKSSLGRKNRLFHIVARFSRMIKKVESPRQPVAAALVSESGHPNCDSVVDSNESQNESGMHLAVDNQNHNEGYEIDDASSSTEDEFFGGWDFLDVMMSNQISPVSSYGSTTAVEVSRERSEEMMTSDDEDEDFVTQLVRKLIPETAEYSATSLSMEDEDDEALVDNVGLGTSFFNPYIC